MKKIKRYIRFMEFEFCHKIVMFSVLYPFIVYGIRFVLRASGIKYLTNSFFYQFLLSPMMLVFIVLLLLFFGLALMYELTCVDIMINLAGDDSRIDLFGIILKGIRGTKKVLLPQNILVLPYCIFLCMGMNVYILYDTLRRYDFVSMLLRSLKDNKTAIVLVIAVSVVFFVVILCGYFTLNFFINNSGSFLQCYVKSVRLMRENFFKVLFLLVAFNVGSVVLYFIIYVITSGLVVAGVYLLGFSYMGVAIYLTFARAFRQIVSIIFLVISIPVSYIVITRMYAKEMKADKRQYVGYDYHMTVVPGWKKHILLGIFLCAFALSFTAILHTRTRNLFGYIELFKTTQIVAHRGSSMQCPENTMPAFSQAVMEFADCIELDVRQSLDGEFVIMHDLSLRRTTGLDVEVSRMTLAQIKELDAGGWKSREYAGEPIPELWEVLDFAKGSIRLNLELKTGSGDKDFAKKLVALLEEYGMTGDCVVSSFDYDILKEIKELNENIQTGYILSVAYGDYFSMENVDFFSINYAFVSKEMVERAHRAGKEVYAWTVNSTRTIKKMLECGVDSVITDNPVLAREIIYADNTNATLLEMLEYVFDR